jgi:mannose-1-phosphate guanylyltransferase
MPSKPDAIVLCGGAGLRLRSITANAPKSLAQIAGRPFLELLLRQLRRYNFQRVILAVGYRQDAIRSHFGERAFGLELAYSAESAPLGTGGAVRNAADIVQSQQILVMNGDSYADADLNRLLRQHDETNADVSMVLAPADERGDYGSVSVDANGNLMRFDEKQASSRARYINAGIYVLSRPILESIPAGIQVSLETALFPQWIERGVSMKAFIHPGHCMDIGTPDRYQAAQQALADAEREAAASTLGE